MPEARRADSGFTSGRGLKRTGWNLFQKCISFLFSLLEMRVKPSSAFEVGAEGYIFLDNL